MNQAAARAQRDAVIDQRVAEDLRARPGERLDVVEDAALERQVAGQAVDDAGQGDRVERAAGNLIHRAQHIAEMGGRPIASQSPGGVRQAVRLQIDQRESRVGRRESAAVEEEAGAHADVGVIGRNVVTIVIDEDVRIAAPDARGDQVHDQRVVHVQAEPGVRLDRMPRRRVSSQHVSGCEWRGEVTTTREFSDLPRLDFRKDQCGSKSFRRLSIQRLTGFQKDH